MDHFVFNNVFLVFSLKINESNALTNWQRQMIQRKKQQRHLASKSTSHHHLSWFMNWLLLRNNKHKGYQYLWPLVLNITLTCGFYKLKINVRILFIWIHLLFFYLDALNTSTDMLVMNQSEDYRETQEDRYI